MLVLDLWHSDMVTWFLKVVAHKYNYIQFKHNTSVTNTIFYFIYNCVFVRATCFDLVGHPQALQEDRSKSCLVFLLCGIPNAHTFLLQEHIVHKSVYIGLVVRHTSPIYACLCTICSCNKNFWAFGIPQCRKTKQLLDLSSWRAWGWTNMSEHVALRNKPLYIK